MVFSVVVNTTTLTTSFPGFSPTRPCGARNRREPWERGATLIVACEQAQLSGKIKPAKENHFSSAHSSRVMAALPPKMFLELAWVSLLASYVNWNNCTDIRHTLWTVFEYYPPLSFFESSSGPWWDLHCKTSHENMNGHVWTHPARRVTTSSICIILRSYARRNQ